MDAKLLTENGWKAVLQRARVRDNGLQRALSTYEKLDDNKFQERLEALANVSKLATNLKKVRDVAANEEAKDYLEDVIKAAEEVRKRVAPQAARSAAQSADIRTWIAKINAAASHKPDLVKLKADLNDMERLAKTRPSSRTGAGPGKGGEDPCSDLRNVALQKYAELAVVALAAAVLLPEAIIAVGGILEAAAAGAAAEGLIAAILLGSGRVNVNDLNRLLSLLQQALERLENIYEQYVRAHNAWVACLREHEGEDMLEEAAERYNQMHERRERIRREAERIRRFHQMLPPPPRPR